MPLLGSEYITSNQVGEGTANPQKKILSFSTLHSSPVLIFPVRAPMKWNEAYIYDRGQKKEITAAVKSITGNDAGYEITFNSGKTFNYGRDRIIYVKGGTEEMDIGGWLFFASGKPIKNIRRILLFGDIYKFEVENGCVLTVNKANLVRIRNHRRNSKVNEVINYLLEVSSLDENLRMEESDRTFLESQLDRLEIREDSAAVAFLNASSVPSHADSGPVIAPFTSNTSQIKAVRNALTSNISVIEGPPGTGKTQTILNIIANLLIRGKTIAVVSGNNEATRNVYERLEKEGLGELCAGLGSMSNRELFFSRPHSKAELRKMLEPFSSSPSDDVITNLETEVLGYYDAAVRKARLREAIADLEREKKGKERSETEYSGALPRFCSDEMSSHNTLKYAAYIETLYSRRTPQLLRKLKMLFWFGCWPGINFSPTAVVDFLQKKYYTEKIRECREELSEISARYPQDKAEKILTEFREQSKMKLFSNLKRRFQNLEDRSFSEDSYKNDSNFLTHYPIVLSTTHSIQSSKPYSVLFDYVIIDESSQVGLTSGLPALAAAKNAVIVGDSKQLPHVIESRLSVPLDEIRKKYRLDDCFDYRRYSLLESIKKKFDSSLPTTLLNEHYRCDPEIISFCNKRFYNGELVIQTLHRNGNGIKLIETSSHSALGRMNERQVKVITDEILPTLKNRNEVGITAPYRAQVDLIRNTVSDSSILTDTVHKFQGKERSVMILSTTSDRTTVYPDSERTDFLNNPNLINVAVSRAKDRLYVIASSEALSQEGTLLGDLACFTRYSRGGESKMSAVWSVFDLMFEDYSRILEPLKKKIMKVSQFDSENIIWTLLNGYCSSGEFGPLGVLLNYPLRMVINTALLTNSEDIRFVENENTHCDYVVYSLLDKSIRLIVEVDGKQHTEELQSLRDQRKDRILCSAGLQLIRIKTTSVDAEKRIKDALKHPA